MVLKEAVDDVAAAEVLYLLDVVLDPVFELLDLRLVLLGELLHVFVEDLVLVLLLFRECLVLGEQFDLPLEERLVVGGECVQDFVLLGVVLDDLPVHLIEVLLGLLDEAQDFSLEVVGVAVVLELLQPLLETGVLIPEMRDPGLTHF